MTTAPRSVGDAPSQFCSNVALSLSTLLPGPIRNSVMMNLPVNVLHARPVPEKLRPGWVSG
jgi:hypothetical protein